MIVYNDPESHPLRSKVTPPSLAEMELLIDSINESFKASDVKKRLLQRMIWHYENLEHFYTTHINYHVTERLMDQNKLEGIHGLFERSGMKVIDGPYWSEQEKVWKVKTVKIDARNP